MRLDLGMLKALRRAADNVVRFLSHLLVVYQCAVVSEPETRLDATYPSLVRERLADSRVNDWLERHRKRYLKVDAIAATATNIAHLLGVNMNAKR